MNRIELLKEFYVEKNYEKLKNILSNSVSVLDKEILARIYIEEKCYAYAADIYKHIGMTYEYGRCKLLQGDSVAASEIWKSIKEESPPVLWGKSLLEFINLYVINIPTFFQIRAFLEVDFDALLNAGLITFCENIANGAHLLAKNNQESYKFIGRVFVNNGYFELAEIFLDRAKDICYIDPEVHFLLAKCYLNSNNKIKAKNALITSLEKGYGYFPAKKLLENLK